LSRYGLIFINNKNDWSVQDGIKSTPYMRDILLYSGQDDNYEKSCEHIKKYLRVEADDSQINRLCVHYGGLLEEQTKDLESNIIERTTNLSKDLEKDEVVYAMFDGCMLPTRPHKIDGEDIGSWKEMKLGRVFREKDHLDLGNKSNVIRESIYVSHFGKHQDFTNKLELVVDKFECLEERLVFINDGAVWIANFIKANYPKATDILDFYHASEYLHEFSKVIFSKKTQNEERLKWVDKQILRLLNDKIKSIIEEIREMTLSGKTKMTAQQKILTYYEKNQTRMLYKTYRDRGLLIGSGPIESAHRFVLQKRMKQSGQNFSHEARPSKWTKKGGQAIANLRVFYLNNQWNKVIQLINNDVSKTA
jgi:hypothetical protein